MDHEVISRPDASARAEEVQRPLTVRFFILRGIAAGAASGAATALFLRVLTETQIGFALEFEDATGLGLPPGDAAEFSRTTQQFGGMSAAVIYGAVLGLVLGVSVAALRHRIPGRNDFERAAKVATAAFVGMFLIPALKYPPNPPAVGDPDTISQRTGSYLLLMAASIIVVFLTWYFWQRLTSRGIEGAARFLLGGGVFFVAAAFLLVAFPASPDVISPPDSDAAPALEISADAPKDVLDGLLATAKVNEDGWIRNPAAPDEPLDLEVVTDSADLIGMPAAVSTTKLVEHAYTSTVWNFRMLSIGGIALMWAVMAGVLGLLLDRPQRSRHVR